MESTTKKPTQPEEVDALRVSQLMPLVYDELRRLARRHMARERAGLTLEATALVHEAYLRLMKEKRPPWRDRAHFCAIAANAMREILVERARARAALKRGGSRVRVSLSQVRTPAAEDSQDLLALHEALERLNRLDPQLARLVELRYFGGLTVEEAADAMGTSPATVKRGWSMARAWLQREMERSREP